MTFPLHRLPLLASIKVIKNTEVNYLISLTQLSTRAKTLVKLSKVHIELTVFLSRIEFQKIADRRMVRELEFSIPSEKPADIPFNFPRHSQFDSKIKYLIRAYKKIMDDFVEFFKICSVSFKLESACSFISCCFMEHAKGLGLQFTTAQVVIGGANPGVYQSLLKICSNASQLLVYFETEEPFTFQGFNEYRTHKFRFSPKVRGVDWFTVDHLCALINCSEVSVEGLNWSNEHYNRFLKFWMASDGNLKSCELWACRASIISRVIMDEINNRELGPLTYEIERADGVKAEVLLSFSSCNLTVIDA